MKLIARLTVLLTMCFAMTGAAFAQSAPTESGLAPGNASPQNEGFYLKRSPGWSIGMETYAGIAVLSSAEGSLGHAMAGGLSRVRLGYVEMGVGVELSDMTTERWQQVGGFVGAYLPIAHWVDFDTTVGLAKRSYLNPDTRYGPGGLDVRGATLTYRLGFSDRPVSDLFGLRLGAALLIDVDLSHHDVPWQYYLGPILGTVSSTSHFGGVTTGLVACLGFDVAFRQSVVK